MKKAIVMATGLVVLTASLSVGADQKTEDAKFCAAAAAYQSDSAELKALGPHSTMGEVRAASDRLQSDVSAMQSAASHMKTPAAKQFLDATNQLTKSIQNVPDDATLQQARTTIQTNAQNAQAAGRQLAKEAGCPVTAPQQEPSPHTPY
jgi:hypothetical protein